MATLANPTNLWMLCAFLLAVLAAAAALGWMAQGKHRRTARLLLGLILGGFLTCFIWLTLFQRTPMTDRQLLTTPFRSYRRAFSLDGSFHIRDMEEFRQVLLNILVTMPLGFVLPPLLDRCRHRWLLTALCGLMLTLAVEAAQYVFRLGWCEVDDIINNALGCVLGMGLYVPADRLAARIGEAFSVR